MAGDQTKKEEEEKKTTRTVKKRMEKNKSERLGVVSVRIEKTTFFFFQFLFFGVCNPPLSGTPPYVYISCHWLAPTLQNIFMYIGVGVGWQRRYKTCQSLRELDNRGTAFCFFRGHRSSRWLSPGCRFCFCFCGHHDGYRVRSYCAEWRTLTPHKGKKIASRGVNMVRHPRGSYIVIPIAVSGVATPENKVTPWSLSFKSARK